MQGLLKDHLVENADGEQFCYSLTCAGCGMVWKSTPVSGRSGKESRLAARKAAAEEAAKQIHMCSFCGRPVCGTCFTDVEGISMCQQCARRLRERVSAQ